MATTIHDTVQKARMLIAAEAEDCRNPPPKASADDIQFRIRNLLRFLIEVEQVTDLMADLDVRTWETLNDVKKRLHVRKTNGWPDGYGIKLLDRLYLKCRDVTKTCKAFDLTHAYNIDRSYDVLINEDIIDLAFDAAIALEGQYESRFA